MRLLLALLGSTTLLLTGCATQPKSEPTSVVMELPAVPYSD